MAIQRGVDVFDPMWFERVCRRSTSEIDDTNGLYQRRQDAA
jgi:hypothetical protein